MPTPAKGVSPARPQRRRSNGSSAMDGRASYNASQPEPSSSPMVRFAKSPTHIPSQTSPKSRLKRHSEPLRSALLSANARRQSFSRPPPSLHVAAARASELDQRSQPLIQVYQALTDASFRGKYLHDPGSVKLRRRAQLLWNDLEDYKTFFLFDRGPFHQHFIDTSEYTAGLSSASRDAALFQDIEQSIHTANCAIFAHYVWDIPQDDSQIKHGHTWQHRSLAPLKEAWRVFWPTVIPSDAASLDLTTRHLLEAYLELCTQAFAAQHFATLEGMADDSAVSAEVLVYLQEYFDPEPVLSALSYGKLAFETQNQQDEQSQATRQRIEDMWTVMAEQRVRDIQASLAAGSRLNETYTPLEAAVRLTDLAWLSFGGQRSEQSQESTSDSQQSSASLHSAHYSRRSDSPSMSVELSVRSWTSGSYTSDTFETESIRHLTAAERLAALREAGAFDRGRSRPDSSGLSASYSTGSSAISSPGRRSPASLLSRSSLNSDETESIDSLDREELAHLRAEWLAELIAQEESISDSEHDDASSFLSTSGTEDYFDSEYHIDSSDDTVMADLTAQERGEALREPMYEDQIERARSQFSSTSQSARSASLISSGETPSLDSPTRHALALPSTPDRPFATRLQQRTSSALVKTRQPRTRTLSPSDESQGGSQSQSPQSQRQVRVLRLRQGRILRESVTGTTPNLLRNKGPRERLTRFGSQDSSESDVFLQRREISKRQLTRQGLQDALPTERAQDSREELDQQSQQRIEQADSSAHVAQQPDGQSSDTRPSMQAAEEPPARQIRYRLPPSRQPRSQFLYVEIETNRNTREVGSAHPTEASTRRVTRSQARLAEASEMEDSFARLGVTPDVREAPPPHQDDALTHEDVPDGFHIDEQPARRQEELQAPERIATASALSPTAQRRVAELMELEGHGPGEFEGDDDADLRATRKQLTLEYWFARERPGLEHLPEPKSTGPVPHTQHRNARRDAVLGVVDEEDEVRGGDVVMVVLSQDTEQGADETWRDERERQAIDAAAALSDPEDETSGPSRSTRNSKVAGSRGTTSTAKSGRSVRRAPIVLSDDEEGAGEVDEAQGTPSRASAAKRTARASAASNTSSGGKKGKKGVGRPLSSLRAAEKRAAKRFWTPEETKCFLDAMYKLARLKRENPSYKIYSEILSRHGKYGSESRILAARDNGALKDKARCELWRMKREGEVIPYWKHLFWSKVFEGRAPSGSRRSGPASLAGAKSRYERTETIESQPHDFDTGEGDDDDDGIQTPPLRVAPGDVVRGSQDPIEELEMALDAASLERNRDGVGGARLTWTGSKDGSGSALTSLPSTQGSPSATRHTTEEVEMEVLPATYEEVQAAAGPSRRGRIISPIAQAESSARRSSLPGMGPRAASRRSSLPTPEVETEMEAPRRVKRASPLPNADEATVPPKRIRRAATARGAVPQSLSATRS